MRSPEVHVATAPADNIKIKTDRQDASRVGQGNTKDQQVSRVAKLAVLDYINLPMLKLDVQLAVEDSIQTRIYRVHAHLALVDNTRTTTNRPGANLAVQDNTRIKEVRVGAKDVVQAITRAPQVILGVLVVLQDNIKDKQDKLLAVLASLECTAAAMDTKLA
jgi:hypothetical protein